MEALPTSWLPTSCLHFEFCFRFSSMSHSVTTSPSLESPKCHSSSSSVQREGTGTGRKWQGSEAGRTAYFGQLCRHVIPSGRGLSQVIGGCPASEGLQGLSSVTFPGSLGIHCPLSLAGNAPPPLPWVLGQHSWSTSAHASLLLGGLQSQLAVPGGGRPICLAHLVPLVSSEQCLVHSRIPGPESGSDLPGSPRG